MYQIDIRTAQKNEFVDVTSEVQKIIVSSKVKKGVCYLFIPHTTAGITLNEHADPDVVRDIRSHLVEMVPDDGNYRHIEGNSAAHIKSVLVGTSKYIFVEEGHLVLGTWQGIFFCEFDGPRSRKILVKIIPEE